MDDPREAVATSAPSSAIAALLGAGERAPATPAEPAPPAHGPRPAWQARPAQPSYRAVGWTRRKLRSLAVKAAVPALLTYGLMFNFSVVRGSSMSPGIHDGDRILVDHLSYVFQEVRRGDIVVLQYPLDPDLDYIKRVIGLPGDVVRIHAGRVSVNGVVLDEPYVAEQDGATTVFARVVENSYFVLGDNRPHSSDSREFGLVPDVYVRGKVDLRVWPPSRACASSRICRDRKSVV